MSIKTMVNGEWVRHSGSGSGNGTSSSSGVSYYDVDLTATVTAECNSTETQTFDVSSVVDGAALMFAANTGKTVRLHFLTHYDFPINGEVFDFTFTESVILHSKATHENTVYFNSVYFRNDTGSSNVRLGVEIDDDRVYITTLTYSPDPVKAYVDETISGVVKTVNGTAPDENGNVEVAAGSVELDATLSVEGQAADAKAVGDALAEIPVSVADDGYTDIKNQRRVTNISTVKADSTITATFTFEGGKVSTSEITIDDNGYPSKIVTDDIECSLSWEGFDA